MTKNHHNRYLFLKFVALALLVLSGCMPQVSGVPHADAPAAPTPSPTAPITSDVAPRNIILFIGDGMGAAQTQAASLYRHGSPGALTLHALPHTSQVTVNPAGSEVPDSAAAATALATGRKVSNGVISQSYPGDGRDLETLLEFYQARGKRVGLVTTTYATHATPAAFAAHARNRNHQKDIAADYLEQVQPDLLLGGGRHGLTAEAAQESGCTVVTDRAGLSAVPSLEGTRLCGLFGGDHFPYEYDAFSGETAAYETLPHLAEMVTHTLRLLAPAPEGFFLMVEGGRIDHAGHDNNLPRNIFETLAFDDAVAVALAWAAGRDDTLILVTADHETGGLQVTQHSGPGEFPTVSWAGDDHTAAPVPVYAWGVNAALVEQARDNTDLYWIMRAGH